MKNQCLATNEYQIIKEISHRITVYCNSEKLQIIFNPQILFNLYEECH